MSIKPVGPHAGWVYDVRSPHPNHRTIILGALLHSRFSRERPLSTKCSTPVRYSVYPTRHVPSQHHPFRHGAGHASRKPLSPTKPDRNAIATSLQNAVARRWGCFIFRLGCGEQLQVMLSNVRRSHDQPGAVGHDNSILELLWNALHHIANGQIELWECGCPESSKIPLHCSPYHKAHACLQTATRKVCWIFEEFPDAICA